MRRLLFLLCILALVAGAACSFRAPDSRMPLGEGLHSDGLELPSFAPEADIVRHLGYTAAYNHTTLCPDWVAWELTADEAAGTLDNHYPFSRDPDVSFPKASREDYANTGWDKGHMAPRADMKWSAKALEESYYFTNICPQDHEMNSGAWRKIEELTRRVARAYGQVWVVCGPLYGDNPRHIGPARVQVPDRFYKALAVITPDGYATVAFLMDNTPQHHSPRTYAVAVDSVEALAGIDLFPAIDSVAEVSFDWQIWNR